ncbi:MAG: Nif3-like dinuclear metal center hexameric protein [Lachnospiraceae bacterium]|nr:Nif3-like dinuclear metal center hexameric protein [Lachnospiraceae bacterium]
MKCRKILSSLYKKCPPSLAEEWDNVGLLTGRPEKEVRRAYIALDATDEVIEHAVENRSDMLITHHPMIFHPMKTITGDDFTGRRIMELIRHDISYAALHTNYDIACMAENAAGILKLKDISPLCSLKTGEDGRETGLGRVGTLEGDHTLKECADLVKERFSIPSVRIYGDPDSAVETVAILPGSGGGEISDAIRNNADVYITGDISHHQGLDAVLQGLSVIDAGHYGIEKIFIEDMRDYFLRELPEVTVFTEGTAEPFEVL